ncbi:argonaute/piwi family protein [Halobellus sp. GM3]|uniref:argonaute/piwi family protein n=1 Tax=Halobellus sp. GM3 TaxID=3458410 RepID=UPI00403DF99C
MTPEDSPFTLRHLEEPEIQFEGGTETSPKRGLIRYGPRLYEEGHHTIKLGIIGDRDSIRRLTELLHDMEVGIHPGTSDKPWQVPYPGLGKSSPLNLSINAKKGWRRQIRRRDIQSVTSKSTPRDRMERFLKLVRKDIEIIERDSVQPNAIIVCIPQEVMDACTPENQDHAQIQSEGSDLRNRIKLIGMEARIPTQLIKPSTLAIRTDRQRASRAWNLTVGLLYKSQRGHPWKTRQIEDGHCYAGLSFYRERNEGDDVIRAALAHVFHGRDHIILQSDPLPDITEDENGSPHLSYEAARQVGEQILEYYEAQKGTRPSRFVLHKPSVFWEEEREGLLDATDGVRDLDLVWVRRRPKVRLFPPTDYPAMRGTLLSVPDDDVHYLYTSGYVPEETTYQGSGVPSPIEIRPDEICETPSLEICKEILFFTKLDWNTSDYAIRMPATVSVAKRVGTILSEVDTESISEVRPQYFYYM